MKKFIRLIFYVGTLIIAVIAVQMHKKQVIADKEQVKESVLSIWQEKGVPVVTYTVGPQDMTENIFVTLQFCDSQQVCFFQSTDKSKNLNSGDLIFDVTDGKSVGKISSVSGVNPYTGLVKSLVKLNDSFKEKIKKNGSNFSVVSIGVKKLSQVLTVPTSSIGYDKDSGFVWLYNDGNPKKQSIKLGAQSRDLTQVTTGLSSGDTIVYQGQGMLELYDTARTIKNYSDNESLKLN